MSADAFFGAVEAGRADEVRALLERHPALARARDPDGATALHHAAFRGDRALIDLLLAAGADVNARDGAFDATPAGWAVHALRERGGLLAIEIEDVLYALRCGDLHWVERLVTRHPALRQATDREGVTLARRAAETGNPALERAFAGERQAAAPRSAHISVMLAVLDAPAAVAWYSRALGAVTLWDLGSVVGLQIAGAPIFVGQPENNGWESPVKLGTTSVMVEVFCDDPDAFVLRAVKAGADARPDPVRDHETPWGTHRQGGFVDPFGHRWLVGDRSPLQRHREGGQ